MTDNKDPLFDSAYFNPNDLANKIIKIYENIDEYNKIINNLIVDYEERLHINNFKNNLLKAINT